MIKAQDEKKDTLREPSSAKPSKAKAAGSKSGKNKKSLETDCLDTSRPFDRCLRLSDARVRLLGDAMPQIVWTTRSTGEIDYFNQRWRAYTGCDGEESPEVQWTAYVHPEDACSYTTYWRTVVGRHGILETECRIRRFDGVYRWHLVRAVPIRDDGENILQWVGTATDVNDQRLSEDALRDSEAKLRTVIQSAPIALFSFTKDGFFTFTDGSVLKRIGLTPGALVGKNVLNVFKGYPDVLDHVKRAMSGESFSCLISVANRWLETSYTPEFDESGNVSCVIGTAIDVTDRHAADTAVRMSQDQLELRVSERTKELAKANSDLEEQIAERCRVEEDLQRLVLQTEQMLAAIASILIGIDENGMITTWNATARRTFGYTTQDVLGKPLTELGIKWDWVYFDFSMTACHDAGANIRVDDVRFTRLDGKEGFLGLSLNPIVGMEGEPIGLLILGSDVTERKQLESQLGQAQKLESIGQLAAGIAHEINTPIQYVGDNTRFFKDAFGDFESLLASYGSLLKAAALGPVDADMLARLQSAFETADVEYLIEEVPKAIEQSLEGVERVAHIVRAMKDFSHPGSSDKSAVDLNRALDSTLTVAKSEWKYVADVVTDFDPNLPVVPCLPGDLNQVFLNIIVNAAHAIADVVGDGASGKGTITVTTSADDEWVEVRISDTGTGIPEAIRQRIFDPFFTTKGVGKGTGQGLAISHSVVTEKHQGSIMVESETGRGSTFIIRLPLNCA